MTEEEQKNLAEAVAKTVIAAMEKRQKEFDEEFNQQLEEHNASFEYVKLSDKEAIEALKELLAKALQDEDYIEASKINSKIVTLRGKNK
tara:strand:- start:57 stop:323 length:267 start_codon:yes stop_codon:yes gene_type:complete